MRASWIRISAILPLNDKIVALPSDGARFAWVVALCQGKFCEEPGVWTSEAQWKEAMGRRAKWLEGFIRVGLMTKSENGRISVKNWKSWQTDPTAKDRKERHEEAG